MKSRLDPFKMSLMIGLFLFFVPAAGEAGSAESLIDAAKRGDADGARALIASGADLNGKDPETGASPLVWAVATDHLKVAQMLLDAGAAVDAPDAMGRSALLLAARKGNLNGAKLLLAHSANVNWTDPKGMTPLMAASTYQGTTEITALLLDHGASLTMKTHAGMDALDLAIETGRSATAGLLIRSGANVEGRLRQAVRMRQIEIVKILLASGANVNDKDADGTTPLIVSALYNDGPIMRELLKAGADVSAVSRSEEIYRILIETGKKEITLRENGVTALFLAESNSNPELIQLLRGAGATR